MKKWLLALLCVSLVFGVTACGGNQLNKASDQSALTVLNQDESKTVALGMTRTQVEEMFGLPTVNGDIVSYRGLNITYRKDEVCGLRIEAEEYHTKLGVVPNGLIEDVKALYPEGALVDQSSGDIPGEWSVIAYYDKNGKLCDEESYAFVVSMTNLRYVDGSFQVDPERIATVSILDRKYWKNILD